LVGNGKRRAQYLTASRGIFDRFIRRLGMKTMRSFLLMGIAATTQRNGIDFKFDASLLSQGDDVYHAAVAHTKISGASARFGH